MNPEQLKALRVRQANSPLSAPAIAALRAVAKGESVLRRWQLCTLIGLERRGLIRRVPGGWELTRAGGLADRNYRRQMKGKK